MQKTIFQTVGYVYFFVFYFLIASSCTTNIIGSRAEVITNVGDGNVSFDQNFLITFTAPIDTTSVTTSSFFVVAASDDNSTCNPDLALEATVLCVSSTSCQLTPTVPLEVSSDYRLCLTNDIKFLESKIYGIFNGYEITFTTNDAVLESLSLSPSELSMNVEDTQQFTVTAIFDDETTQTITDDLVWSSSDESLVTITENGLATALALGEVDITVTQNETGFSASAVVSVDFPAGGVFRYTVGGTTSGLTGTVVLQINGGDDLTQNANGDFTFDTTIIDGEEYEVTVLTQPAGQTCTVFNGSGTVNGSNVQNVTVTCTNNNAVISVTGSPLTLETNGTTGTLTISNTSFTVTAINISSNFNNTALDGNVTETGNTCSSVAPQASCTLTYTPGSTVVSETDFVIQGSNTNTITGAIQIDSGITLDTVNPSSGSAAGGTGVTLTGVGVIDTISVTFGGIAATTVNVVNSTTVTAVAPAHVAGVVDVVITTPSGSATKTNAYTYVTTAVGQLAYGGTIACLNGGLNNLIAATTDNSTAIEWGGNGITTNTTSNTDGASNTATTVSALGTGLTYAAKLCNDYQVDSQGNTPCQPGNTCYNDWFLPAGNNLTTSGQLNCLYTNQVSIGGFASNNYWSSTENDNFSAQQQDFNSGIQSTATKDSSNRVRCVRAFTP